MKSDTFFGINSDCILLVPCGCKGLYAADPNWGQFKIIEEFGCDITPSAVTLNTQDMILLVGQSDKLTATVAPDDTTNPDVVWSSDNEAVATVSADGTVTAISVGVADITATCGSVSTTCKVTVNPVLASAVTLNTQDMTLLVGQSDKLTATVVPDDTANPDVVWSSDNEAVATVDQFGLVTAVAPGNAVITVDLIGVSNVFAKCNITVVSPISSIILSETEIVLGTGEYRTLTATAIPGGETDETLIWTSSNDAVARVQNGTILAVADGEALVTVSAGDGSNVSASCHVIVRTLVSEIILSENNLSLKEGEFKKISATVLPDDATITDVIWTTSDESVATVKNGLILAHKKGSAVIRVEATDGSGVYAECVVEVTNDAGIDDVTSDGISISTEPFIATVHVIRDDTIIRLFDMSGKMLYFGYGPRIEVVQSGVYILAVCNKTFRIIL